MRPAFQAPVANPARHQRIDRNARAKKLVPRALTEVLGGPENVAWHAVKDAGGKTRVKAGRAE